MQTLNRSRDLSSEARGLQNPVHCGWQWPSLAPLPLRRSAHLPCRDYARPFQGWQQEAHNGEPRLGQRPQCDQYDSQPVRDSSPEKPACVALLTTCAHRITVLRAPRSITKDCQNECAPSRQRVHLAARAKPRSRHWYQRGSFAGQVRYASAGTRRTRQIKAGPADFVKPLEKALTFFVLLGLRARDQRQSGFFLKRATVPRCQLPQRLLDVIRKLSDRQNCHAISRVNAMQSIYAMKSE